MPRTKAKRRRKLKLTRVDRARVISGYVLLATIIVWEVVPAPAWLGWDTTSRPGWPVPVFIIMFALLQILFVRAIKDHRNRIDARTSNFDATTSTFHAGVDTFDQDAAVDAGGADGATGGGDGDTGGGDSDYSA